MRQKITATVIALVLGSFAAVGAFASQDKVDFGAAGHLFSGSAETSLEPGVDTPTSTATVDASATATATDTSTPEPTATDTAVPAATDTPSATETVGPTETAVAGCKDDEDDDDAAVGTPAAGGSHDDDCDDEHEDNGKHEGLECGLGHDMHDGEDDGDEDDGGTPVAPAETATPDVNGTPTIVAEMPVHCHGEHGVEHDEGHPSGDDHSGGDHEDD